MQAPLGQIYFCLLLWSYCWSWHVGTSKLATCIQLILIFLIIVKNKMTIKNINFEINTSNSFSICTYLKTTFSPNPPPPSLSLMHIQKCTFVCRIFWSFQMLTLHINMHNNKVYKKSHFAHPFSAPSTSVMHKQNMWRQCEDTKKTLWDYLGMTDANDYRCKKTAINSKHSVTMLLCYLNYHLKFSRMDQSLYADSCFVQKCSSCQQFLPVSQQHPCQCNQVLAGWPGDQHLCPQDCNHCLHPFLGHISPGPLLHLHCWHPCIWHIKMC